MLWRISVDTQRERFDTMFNFPSNGGLPGFRIAAHRLRLCRHDCIGAVRSDSSKLYLGWRHVELYDAARKDPSSGAGTRRISGYRSR